MNMLDDSALLQRFAATRVEDDFAELVRRNLNLVYSAALRQVGGDHQFAEEVTQNVFTDLARKAGTLTNHISLTGWLYTSAHYAAAKKVRGERRRRVREQEASHMQQTHASPAIELDWEQLQPVLDDAMHALPEADRDVILQRYFQRMPFLQIGARLGLTENAARMRAERALDKLRGILAARGVSATAVALATVLTAQAVLVAPAALAGAIVSTSLATTAVAGAVASGGLIAAAKLKVLIPSACAVALLVGAVWQRHELDEVREENAKLQRAAMVAAESSAVAIPNAVGATEEQERAKLELLRLRGELGRLRRDLAEQQMLAATVAATNSVADQSQQKAQAQVAIEARFYTGTDEALEVFKDHSTAIVSAAEMDKLATHLQAADSVELLAKQRVMTTSGQQATVMSFETRTNLSTGAVTESGLTLDVLPTSSEDGQSVELNLVATKITDKPVEIEAAAATTLPVPAFGLSQMTAKATVWDGQTVALARQSEGKKLVVFVTPTLIDSAGNRVHPEPSTGSN
jgi:RNA polymerase sigma factor (sigma-70 family)